LGPISKSYPSKVEFFSLSKYERDCIRHFYVCGSPSHEHSYKSCQQWGIASIPSLTFFPSPQPPATTQPARVDVPAARLLAGSNVPTPQGQGMANSAEFEFFSYFIQQQSAS